MEKENYRFNHSGHLPMNEGKRVLYLDLLRIFAAYGIVMLHVMSNAFGKAAPDSFNWNVMNGYNSVVRCCVPIFVMISGALFLNLSKPLDLKKLYTRNILRLVISFLFWSLFYASCYTIYFHLGREYFFTTFITGYAHLWFLPMLIGLYVITPILRKLMEQDSLTIYFLLLSFIFTFLSPEILRMMHSASVDKAYSNMNFFLTLGYTPYFVAGAYLSKIELSRYLRRWIYAVGTMTLLLCGVLTNFFSSGDGIDGTFYGSFSPLILFGSIALFVLGKYFFSHFRPQGNFRQLVLKLSTYSFGVYLIHPIVINIFHQFFKVDAESFPALWWVPVLSLIIFIVSACFTALIAQIPFLGKIV